MLDLFLAATFSRLTSFMRLPQQSLQGVTAAANKFPSTIPPQSTKYIFYRLVCERLRLAVCGSFIFTR